MRAGVVYLRLTRRAPFLEDRFKQADAIESHLEAALQRRLGLAPDALPLGFKLSQELALFRGELPLALQFGSLKVMQTNPIPTTMERQPLFVLGIPRLRQVPAAVTFGGFAHGGCRLLGSPDTAARPGRTARDAGGFLLPKPGGLAGGQFRHAGGSVGLAASRPLQLGHLHGGMLACGRLARNDAWGTPRRRQRIGVWHQQT